MNNLKLIAITLLVGLGLGTTVTKMYFPKIQEVNIEKEVIRTDIKVVTRIIERADGTKETVIETVDKTVKKEDKKTTIDKTLPIKMNKVSVIAKYDFSEKKENYGLLVERRLIGPVFVGAYGDTKRNVGLALGVEF